MARVTWHHLRGRLAQRLLALLVVTAIVPVTIASALVLWQLSDYAKQRSEEQLQAAAKSTGMNALGELKNAAVILEATARLLHGGTQLPQDLRLIRGSGSSAVNLFATIESVPADLLSSHLAAAGIPALSGRQRQWLERGETVLASGHRGMHPGVQPYLIRLDPQGDHAVVGKVVAGNIWTSDTELLRGASLIVADMSGAVLHQAGTLPGPDPMTNGAALPAAKVPESRQLTRWSWNGEQWQGVRWDLFLASSFAADPLQVIVVEPVTPFTAEIGRLTGLLPALLTLALALGLWLAIVQIRRYMEPLSQLTEGTRQLASRAFDAPLDIRTGDELAELGQAFNHMATRLKAQFSALETMAAIDRQLLGSPGVEHVLDSILPRIATVTGCSRVSVVIADADSPSHARSYDLAAGSDSSQPVRRVAFDAALLARFPEGMLLDPDCHPVFALLPFLEPMRAAACARVELWPLRQRGELLGSLCLGYSSADVEPDGQHRYGLDFADRLAVALTNFRNEERLYRQAHFDSVTGLANRHLMRERLQASFDRSQADGCSGALLYIDLDNFKRVNDSAGHSAGDELLQVVATRLRAGVGAEDLVARLGGDEFAIHCVALTDPEQLLVIANSLIASVSRQIDIAGGRHFVSASIGIVLLGRDGRTVEEVLRNGDIAMYRAKESGRGKAVFFSADMPDRTRSRAVIEAGLRQAIAEQGFEVHYQPIHDRTGLVAAEALVRWRAPDGALVSPGAFVPVAEESGLIIDIGKSVIESVCRHFRAWSAQGCAPVYFAVNVSPRQLCSAGFVDWLLGALERHEVPRQALQIEITESVVAEGPEALSALQALSAAGLSIALDDFGTGYSSLSYLRTFPIDVVKVDRSFIVDLPDNDAACQLVGTIIGMAHGLGKKVVAEGVETPQQRDYLLRNGCDRLQGYWFGKPMPPAEFNRLLVRNVAQGTPHRQSA